MLWPWMSETSALVYSPTITISPLPPKTLALGADVKSDTMSSTPDMFFDAKTAKVLGARLTETLPASSEVRTG